MERPTGAEKMEGGNGATGGSGITQFAEGEPKRRNYHIPLIIPNRNAGISNTN